MSLLLRCTIRQKQIQSGRGRRGVDIGDSGYSASMTMVNRVRHQLHQLPVRAVVTNHPIPIYRFMDWVLRQHLCLSNCVVVQYLLKSAIQIHRCDYYIRPLTGPLANKVLTVAKAAVDYFDADRLISQSHFADSIWMQSRELNRTSLEESGLFEKGLHDSTEQWIALHPDGTDNNFPKMWFIES